MTPTPYNYYTAHKHLNRLLKDAIVTEYYTPMSVHTYIGTLIII